MKKNLIKTSRLVLALSLLATALTAILALTGSPASATHPIDVPEQCTPSFSTTVPVDRRPAQQGPGHTHEDLVTANEEIVFYDDPTQTWTLAQLRDLANVQVAADIDDQFSDTTTPGWYYHLAPRSSYGLGADLRCGIPNTSCRVAPSFSGKTFDCPISSSVVEPGALGNTDFEFRTRDVTATYLGNVNINDPELTFATVFRVGIRAEVNRDLTAEEYRAIGRPSRNAADVDIILRYGGKQTNLEIDDFTLDHPTAAISYDDIIANYITSNVETTYSGEFSDDYEYRFTVGSETGSLSLTNDENTETIVPTHDLSDARNPDYRFTFELTAQLYRISTNSPITDPVTATVSGMGLETIGVGIPDNIGGNVADVVFTTDYIDEMQGPREVDDISNYQAIVTTNSAKATAHTPEIISLSDRNRREIENGNYTLHLEVRSATGDVTTGDSPSIVQRNANIGQDPDFYTISLPDAIHPQTLDEARNFRYVINFHASIEYQDSEGNTVRTSPTSGQIRYNPLLTVDDLIVTADSAYEYFDTPAQIWTFNELIDLVNVELPNVDSIFESEDDYYFRFRATQRSSNAFTANISDPTIDSTTDPDVANLEVSVRNPADAVAPDFTFGFLLTTEVLAVSDDPLVDDILAAFTTTTIQYSGHTPVDPPDPRPTGGTTSTPSRRVPLEPSNYPSLGVSFSTREQIVSCGYSMDGECVDLMDYLVNYGRSPLEANRAHDFTIRTLSRSNIRRFVIGFGVAGIGLNPSLATAVIRVDVSTNTDGVPFVSNTAIFDAQGAMTFNGRNNASVVRVTCMEGIPSSTGACLQLNLDNVVFENPALIGSGLFAVSAENIQGRTTTHYLN